MGQKPPPKAAKRSTGRRVEIVEDGNKQVLFELPRARTNQRSVAFFILPKSGTVMIHGILGKLARESGLVNCNFDNKYFKLGIPRSKIPHSASSIYVDRGYCYGFSLVPTEYDVPIIGTIPILVHVRDIRDALVSSFYSMRKSHPLPGLDPSGRAEQSVMDEFMKIREQLNRLDLDDGVLWLAEWMLASSHYRQFYELARQPNVLVSRYEDMVYQKVDWALKVCEHFGWNIPRGAVESAVKPFDVFPDQERPDQHLRQVHPGNFKAKLLPETINRLDEMFSEEQSFFRYERHALKSSAGL